MKKIQRFYLMIESEKEIEPKEILFALREARPNWGEMSASLAVQQSVQRTCFPACQTCEYNPCDLANNSEQTVR